MKYILAFMVLCSSTFANEQTIRNFFAYSNEFVTLQAEFLNKCGDTPLKSECHDLEREIKLHTLIKMKPILSLEYYTYWQDFFLISFYSDDYKLITHTKVHKIVNKGSYYIVIAEDQRAVYTYRMAFKDNRMVERTILKKD